MVLALLLGLPVCGGDRSEADGPATGGLSLSVTFSPDALRSGRPVTWSIEVTNGGSEPVTLTFRTGQDGDVVLRRDGTEAYRWSARRFFSQALRHERLDAGQHRTFTLADEALRADPGDYDLEAILAAEPAPPPARRPVTVRR
jgi:Intracellular proteinase inhibitor